MIYEVNFYFEWGLVGHCIWCGNESAYSRFGAGPIDFDKFGFSEKLKEILTELSNEYQSALNWDYPPDPSPWNEEQKENFLYRAENAYKQIVDELGSNFKVNYCVELPD